MPNFIMLVGIPAVGKDSWAREYIKKHPDTVIHSSDDIREELYGDAAYQKSPTKVFELMRLRTLRDLRAGKDVIYNATNLKYKSRKSILSQVKRMTNAVCLCKILVAPIEICKERNAKRERVVPDFVYDRMLGSFQIPFYNEGFDDIEIIHTYDGDKRSYMKHIAEKVKAFGDQKNPHHTLSLFDHCQECGRLMFEKGYSDALAGSIHDYGKIYTQSFDEDGVAHYYQHEAYSAYLALCFGFQLEVSQLANYHMLPYNYKGGEDAWRKRLGEELWKKLEQLNECDKEAH